MGYIDRTIKILSRLHPEWAKKILFPFAKEIISLKIKEIEILETLHKKAIKVVSLEEFDEILRKYQD